MHKNINFFSVLLAFFLVQNLSAQVAKDFEFLDHTSKTTQHQDSKAFNDSFVYVANRETFPMTSINVVNTLTNEIDTVLGTYYGATDLSEFSDGTFDIYLHSMFDYDVCVSGFMHVAYDGNTFQVDTFHSYILPAGFENNVYPYSVSKTKDEGYLLIDGQNLYHSDKLELTELRPASYKAKLFQNDVRDVYMYEDSLIVKINDSSFDTILNVSKPIYEVRNRGLFNDVLMVGQIQTWTDDFSVMIRSWEFEDELKSFYEVNVKDSLLTILSSLENDYSYRTLSETGNETIIASGSYDTEEARSFHQLDDGNILSINNYQVDEISSNQLLFRSVDLEEETMYQSRMVAIDSASIVFFDSDTLDVWVNGSGDTTYYVNNYYNIDVSYINRSDSSVEHINLQSSDVNFSYFYFETGLNFPIKETIQSNGVGGFMAELSFFGTPTNVTFAIPGADYRINNDLNRVYNADVVLDVEKLVFDVDVSIYPNPSYDFLSIEVDENIEEISIFNAQGQLMMHKFGARNMNQVDVSRLAAGAYFIKLRFKNKNEFSIQQFAKF